MSVWDDIADTPREAESLRLVRLSVMLGTPAPRDRW